MASSTTTIGKPGTSKVLSVSTSGTDTTTVTSNAIVRITASADMFVNLGGTTCTSDGTAMFLAAGASEYFMNTGVNLAAKIASGTGSLYITEIN